MCLQGRGGEDLPLPEGILLSTPGIKRENILAKWGYPPVSQKYALYLDLLAYNLLSEFHLWQSGSGLGLMESEMKKTLTKADIVEAIYESRPQPRRMWKTVVEKTARTHEKHGSAGWFPVVERFWESLKPMKKAPRKGRNPQTEESITLPSRKVIVFRLFRANFARNSAPSKISQPRPLRRRFFFAIPRCYFSWRHIGQRGGFFLTEAKTR